MSETEQGNTEGLFQILERYFGTLSLDDYAHLHDISGQKITEAWVKLYTEAQDSLTHTKLEEWLWLVNSHKNTYERTKHGRVLLEHMMKKENETL